MLRGLTSDVTLFFLQILAESTAINIALHATGTYCSKTPLSKKIFDGDKMNVESMTEKCDGISYIEVDLGSTYYIDYVIVYAGKGNDQGQLDFFLVNRLKDSSSKDLCSQYPGFANAVEPGRGMRVNCYSRRQFHSKVRIDSSKNEGLHISEVAVHSLGFGTPRAPLYVGCFDAFDFIDSYTWPACQKTCFENGYLTVVVKGDKTCHCITKVEKGKETHARNCKVKCEDGVRHCGGPESYSVYRLRPSLPVYKGCMKTSEDFTKESTLSGSMTVTKCLQNCDQKYLYAALQGGDFCMCLNKINATMFTGDDCNIKCTGDESLTCGGRGHASVYSNCKQTGEFLSEEQCSELFQCANSFDMHGVCEGGCKQGFVGEHCLEKDVAGCDFEPCDFQTSTCRNLNASYVCECKSGFMKAVNETCIAESAQMEALANLAPLVILPIFLMMFLASFFGYRAIMSQESLIIDDNTVRRKPTLR